MDDDELFADLSRRLRETHRRVAGLQVSDDEKSRVATHLIVINDASKHDLARASVRLDRLIGELDARENP